MPNRQILSTGYHEKPLEKTRNKRQSDKGLSLQWGEGRDFHLSFFRVQYSTIMEINCQQLNAISRHDPCQLSSDISANADLNRSLITQRATCTATSVSPSTHSCSVCSLLNSLWIMSNFYWRNKVAVITGASVGIGASTALSLANAGMIVVGLARRVELIEVGHQIPILCEFILLVFHW